MMTPEQIASEQAQLEAAIVQQQQALANGQKNLSMLEGALVIADKISKTEPVFSWFTTLDLTALKGWRQPRVKKT